MPEFSPPKKSSTECTVSKTVHLKANRRPPRCAAAPPLPLEDGVTKASRKTGIDHERPRVRPVLPPQTTTGLRPSPPLPFP